MDVTLKKYLNLDPKDAISKIYNLINEVKYVNGTFTSVWHNQSLFFENIKLKLKITEHRKYGKICFRFKR